MLKLYYSLHYSSKNLLKTPLKLTLIFLFLILNTIYEPFTPNNDE